MADKDLIPIPCDAIARGQEHNNPPGKHRLVRSDNLRFVDLPYGLSTGIVTMLRKLPQSQLSEAEVILLAQRVLADKPKRSRRK